MQEKNSSKIIWFVVILIIAVAGYGMYKYMKRDTVAGMTSEENKNPNLPVNEIPTYTYKDGVYTATGDYISPGGAETIDVEITLKDDVIVDAKMEPNATRPNSVKMQGIFQANFAPLVIGRRIDDLVLDKVSGSSLTPKGFMEAVEEIKVAAKA